MDLTVESTTHILVINVLNHTTCITISKHATNSTYIIKRIYLSNVRKDLWIALKKGFEISQGNEISQVDL